MPQVTLCVLQHANPISPPDPNPASNFKYNNVPQGMPPDCLVYDDGCNTCSRSEPDGLASCTKKYCDVPHEPSCMDWAGPSFPSSRGLRAHSLWASQGCDIDDTRAAVQPHSFFLQLSLVCGAMAPSIPVLGSTLRYSELVSSHLQYSCQRDLHH